QSITFALLPITPRRRGEGRRSHGDAENTENFLGSPECPACPTPIAWQRETPRNSSVFSVALTPEDLRVLRVSVALTPEDLRVLRVSVALTPEGLRVLRVSVALTLKVSVFSASPRR